MAKYSFELKRKVVLSYQNNEGGYNFLADKYNISHHSVIQRWVNAYQAFGVAEIKIIIENLPVGSETEIVLPCNEVDESNQKG